jgi:hypothetical protein
LASVFGRAGAFADATAGTGAGVFTGSFTGSFTGAFAGSVAGARTRAGAGRLGVERTGAGGTGAGAAVPALGRTARGAGSTAGGAMAKGMGAGTGGAESPADAHAETVRTMTKARTSSARRRLIVEGMALLSEDVRSMACAVNALKCSELNSGEDRDTDGHARLAWWVGSQWERGGSDGRCR